MSLHDTKVPVSVIGWEKGERGGPWEISAGRAPETDDEVAIGRVMADRHDVVRSMAADVMAVMTVIGLIIALALIGLTLFTATIAKQREYGIVKALGPGRARLTFVVLAQAAWTVVLALGLATVLSVAVGAAIEALTPNVAVDIQPAAVLRTTAGAAVVAATAALLPLRRVARVDPATAFRMA